VDVNKQKSVNRNQIAEDTLFLSLYSISLRGPVLHKFIITSGTYSIMPIAPSQLGLAMGLSLILIAIIIACANFIHWYGRKHAIKRASSQPLSLDDLIVPPKHFILLRVLLDKNDHASLAAFQLLSWTLLISFLYIAIWILQLLNGSILAPSPIPESLMALMGISVAVPIVSQGITEYKRLKPRPEGETYIEPNYASMLEENGRPSLLRLQMFLWTLAAFAIFIGSFLTAALSAEADPLTLSLPEIAPTLLFLMGLSLAGYLGSIAYSGTVKKTEPPAKPQQPAQPAAPAPAPAPVRAAPGIREIIPRDVKPKGVLTLLGSGFGAQSDTIMIGEDRVPPASIGRWEEARIEFTVPETISPGSHNLRVISGGETVSGQISVGSPQEPQRLNEIDANIISDIWIDDPSQKGYKVPPIGHFIPDKRYYFFFEFDVPPGTPQWGMAQFRAKFFLDGGLVATRSFMPGVMNGQNYGIFDYLFPAEGKHHIEIAGSNTRTMDIEVKQPPVR
jgi:hypothetical protein